LVSRAEARKAARQAFKISFGKALRRPALPLPPASRMKPDLSRPKTVSRTGVAAKVPSSPAANSPESFGTMTTRSGVELTEKMKELLRLAQEQGYLTYDDIDDVLSEVALSPADLEEIHTRLGNLDVEIVDQAEVDRSKQAEPEEDHDKDRLDSMDDPVRMYMRQMAKVPLLTREQEVAICKRIEEAEIELKRILYGFGFTAKEHIALAEKLISEPPKERFDRVIVDKKVEGREKHLKALRLLVKQVRALDQQVDQKYTLWRGAPSKPRREKSLIEFRKLDRKLQATFLKFFYKQKVLEEMMLVAENIHDKIQTSLRVIRDLEHHHKSTQQQSILGSERAKLKALEDLLTYVEGHSDVLLQAFAWKAGKVIRKKARAVIAKDRFIDKVFGNKTVRDDDAV
jgi:RNA polymerase primary sigma factor